MLRVPILISLLAATPLWALTSDEEIALLLQQVETAEDCTFYRNGSAHTAAEALAHMTRKYRHFKDEIATAEDFIARSATRSLLTRRAYWVSCDGAARQRTADWLTAALSRLRADATTKTSG